MRQHDWSRSSLGAPATWPTPLRSALNLLLDSPLPMWLAWGPDLGFLYNDAFAPFVPAASRTVLGASLRDVLADDWAELAPLVDTVLTGTSLCHTRAVPSPQGARLALQPLRDDEAGAVAGLACTLLDVGGPASGPARDRERETEERRRLAVLATSDAIWDWRLSDGQVVWNQALRTLFGHAVEQTDAQWWLTHIHPDDRSRTEASIHAVIDGGATSWAGEYRFRRADGSYADVFDRGTVLRDAGGAALRMIGAMLDLSERRATEAALHQSERRFRALFESMDEGFCIIEFIDGPHGPLSDYVHIAANPAYTANAGIPDVVGRRVRDMVPEEADGWVEIYRKVLLTGEPVRFERELVMTGRHLELASFRVEPPERRQVAVLFQDVTQRRRAERALRELNETLERRVAEEVAERTRTAEALRQSQKMEAVGQLTGGIAHDFNNMLAVIMNSLELLDRQFAMSEPRALRLIEMARNGGRRAAQLTQRLLAFSRQQPLKPEVVDANRLVTGMSELLRHSLGGAIRLSTRLAPDLWRTHADPNQLENALLNLVVNARDAMPDGGRLSIETANAEVGAIAAAGQERVVGGPWVVITVRDSGCGMPPEVVAKAFDPFFTTKEVGQGSGLGLSQVYGFVRQSGGHVKILSEVGQGTTVQVFLPCLVGAGAPIAPSAETPPVPPPSQGSEWLLVVDDEQDVRLLSAEALRELGYRVIEAASATEALTALKAHPDVALMITDLMMPEMNGQRLAAEARRRRPALKALFMTGYSRTAIEADAAQPSVTDLIVKPFSLKELSSRVRAALDQR